MRNGLVSPLRRAIGPDLAYCRAVADWVDLAYDRASAMSKAQVKLALEDLVGRPVAGNRNRAEVVNEYLMWHLSNFNAEGRADVPPNGASACDGVSKLLIMVLGSIYIYIYIYKLQSVEPAAECVYMIGLRC